MYGLKWASRSASATGFSRKVAPSTDGTGPNPNDPDSTITGTPCWRSRVIKPEEFFAATQMEVDQRDVGPVRGEQALGLRRIRRRSVHAGAAQLKQHLHRVADVPGVFDQQDIEPFQLVG